ncbi:hypothetical protein [Tardiphaga sp.]|uniref:hypothetical protein n=1 Tax=Tardiphaga sp. TaxID=1926292 RepID=UPI002628920B|nr:hypothetical protein [Tardiphaga sp.]MDB5618037.1 hypothetical protein [Tardiphaga sp.]
MIKEWLARTADRSFGFIATVLMRRAIAPLLRIDEASLHEAGLSRAALASFLASPLNTDPGHFFAERIERQEQTVSGATAVHNTVPPRTVASELFLNGQPDARDGPSPRRGNRQSSSKSTLNLAKETP